MLRMAPGEGRFPAFGGRKLPGSKGCFKALSLENDRLEPILRGSPRIIGL